MLSASSSAPVSLPNSSTRRAEAVMPIVRSRMALIHMAAGLLRSRIVSLLVSSMNDKRESQNHASVQPGSAHGGMVWDNLLQMVARVDDAVLGLAASRAPKVQQKAQRGRVYTSLTTESFRNIEIHSLASIRSSFDPPFNSTLPSRYLIKRA